MWKKAFDVRIYNLKISLILALASWQICEVTEEDVRNLTFRLSQISGEWWSDMALLIRWHTYRTLDDVSPRSDFTFLVLVAAPRESTINVLAVGWIPATSPNTDTFSWSARRPSCWWLGRLTVNVFLQLVNVRHIERFFAMMKSMDTDVQVIPQLQPWTQTKPGRWDAYVIENSRLAAFSIVPLPSSYLESDGYLTNSPPSASRQLNIVTVCHPQLRCLFTFLDVQRKIIMPKFNATTFRTFVYVVLVRPPAFVVPVVAATNLPLNLLLPPWYFLLLPTRVAALLQVKTPPRICLLHHPFR